MNTFFCSHLFINGLKQHTPMYDRRCPSSNWGQTLYTLHNQAFISCGLFSTLHQRFMLALLWLLGWMKFRVLTLPPANTTKVHVDSEDLRNRRITAQIFMCIRLESIKHLVKGVITLQRDYKANFWRCSPGGVTSWSIPPKFSQTLKDPGPIFFSARVFDVSGGRIQWIAGQNLWDSSCQ